MPVINGYKDETMREAYKEGGYREHYAMEHGKKAVVFQNGMEYLKFYYSPDVGYQDANGATYSVTERRWVG